MGPRGRYWGRAEGAAAVTAWRASGLSCRAFCAVQGIRHQRLQYWIEQSRVACAVGEGAAGFVELRPSAAPAVGAIAVVCGSGARVQVTAGFDAAVLRAVVEALS